MADSVSSKPWSDYKESDYSIEQWHRACLIHQHTGAPTSKNQCKLPVRTPAGVLNRNGVHAAAAALAGARGGVQASSDEKMKAAAQLVRFYNKMNEEAPPSLSHEEQEGVDKFLAHISRPGSHFDEAMVKRDKGGKFSTKAEKAQAKYDELRAKQREEMAKAFGEKALSMNPIDWLNSLPREERKTTKEQFLTIMKRQLDEITAFQEANQGVDVNLRHDDINTVEGFLKHYGRKGMRWGQRIFSRGSSSSSSESAKTEARPLSDSHRAALIQAKVKKEGLAALSNDEIQSLTNRLNLEVNYAKVAASNTKLARGRTFMNNQLKTGKTLNEMAAFVNSPAGHVLAGMIRPKGTGLHVGTPSVTGVLGGKRKPR